MNEPNFATQDKLQWLKELHETIPTFKRSIDKIKEAIGRIDGVTVAQQTSDYRFSFEYCGRTITVIMDVMRQTCKVRGDDRNVPVASCEWWIDCHNDQKLHRTGCAMDICASGMLIRNGSFIENALPLVVEHIHNIMSCPLTAFEQL